MSIKPLSLRNVMAFLSGIALFMMAIPNAVVQNPLAQATCQNNVCNQEDCSSLPGLPPQNPASRSFDDFITLAYIGAYGRSPNCFERQNEYDNLASAAANNTLLAEARRFVATLFMTQASYNVNDLVTYVQTSEYEQRNPETNVCRARVMDFVADLYRAFLQREPDQAGQCFWANNVCVEGRKKGIRAFEASIEFGNLVSGLFDGGPPCCVTFCHFGYVFNPDTCSCEPDPNECRFGICQQSFRLPAPKEKRPIVPNR
jgi:Domain of unknown function (DUF4214)